MIVTTELDGPEIARVDALAAERGTTREDMLAILILSGIAREEEKAAPPSSERRPKAGVS